MDTTLFWGTRLMCGVLVYRCKFEFFFGAQWDENVIMKATKTPNFLLNFTFKFNLISDSILRLEVILSKVIIFIDCWKTLAKVFGVFPKVKFVISIIDKFSQ